MTITLWLNYTFQLLAKIVQNDIFMFIVLAIGFMALYGVITIIIQFCFFFKR